MAQRNPGEHDLRHPAASILCADKAPSTVPNFVPTIKPYRVPIKGSALCSKLNWAYDL